MKKVVIVGGGSAGITVSSRLLKKRKDLEVVIVDPAHIHFYQPLWTLVGAGEARKENTIRLMSEVIPPKAKWVQESVETFHPEKNLIILKESGVQLNYDYLVVCPGIQIDWNHVQGLEETLGQNGVCSIYSFQHVDSTWKTIQETKSGNALFTFPHTAIKCGGAPQKIMYLAEHYFRKSGVREQINVEFVSAGKSIFGVTKYRNALEKVIQDRGIQTSFHLNLEKIDGQRKLAIFKDLNSGEVVEKKYSMIHVVPPMSAPDFIKRSPLANSNGWIDVDKFSLQHVKYKNVFSLGDASSLPTSKTGAAIRKQAPTVVTNLLSLIDGNELVAKYEGYTSCPLITGYGKLILAEFDYEGNPVETFPFDQAKERWSMYLLKKHFLPQFYWHGMLKGRM